MADQLATLKKFLVWMGDNEIQMRRWADSLNGLLALGVATCDDLELYNQQAAALYSTEWWVLKMMTDAGVKGLPPEPPMPPIFGRNVAVYRERPDDDFPVIKWDICDAGGGVPAGVHIYMTRPQTTTTGELGALPALGAFGWFLAGLIGAGLIYLTGDALEKLATAVFNGDAVMNRMIANDQARFNANYNEQLLKCIKENLSPTATPQERTATREWCVKNLAKPPVAPWAKPFLVFATPVLIAGAAVGIAYLVTRTIDRKSSR